MAKQKIERFGFIFGFFDLYFDVVEWSLVDLQRARAVSCGASIEVYNCTNSTERFKRGAGKTQNGIFSIGVCLWHKKIHNSGNDCM